MGGTWRCANQLLEAEPVHHGTKAERTVDIKLTKFLPSLAEVPTKELEAIRERALKSGMDFIDFWAVDFNWQPGQPFNHHWQDYRTRKDRSLKTVSDAKYKYPKYGKFTACVKVVDTFGCDTSITVEVRVWAPPSTPRPWSRYSCRGRSRSLTACEQSAQAIRPR